MTGHVPGARAAYRRNDRSNPGVSSCRSSIGVMPSVQLFPPRLASSLRPHRPLQPSHQCPLHAPHPRPSATSPARGFRCRWSAARYIRGDSRMIAHHVHDGCVGAARIMQVAARWRGRAQGEAGWLPTSRPCAHTRRRQPCANNTRRTAGRLRMIADNLRANSNLASNECFMRNHYRRLPLTCAAGGQTTPPTHRRDSTL
jgi:hypothetical protein